MADWDPHAFQAAVNEFLQRQDWSQAELARAVGISPGVVNRWMQPVDSGMLVQPSDATLRKVAPVMRVPLNDLLRLAGRADIEDSGKRRSPELEALFADVEAGHAAIEDESLKSRLADAVRALYQPHIPRRRDRRRASQQIESSKPEGDTPWGMLLTPA